MAGGVGGKLNSDFNGANLTARSRIFFALKNVGDSSAVGIPKIATLTPGSPGSFTFVSIVPGGNTQEAGDVSIYDYLIVGE